MLIEPIKIFDFKKGIWTVKPPFQVPLDATPQAKNVWYDKYYTLSKMPGTTGLITYTNNDFATNPLYQLFNFISSSGYEQLIIQAINTTMQVWRMDSSSVSAAQIKNNLALYRQANFATYKGRLYMVNGVDPLQYWEGSGTNWKQYDFQDSEHEAERFRYVCATGAGGKGRLWGACSNLNPCRVIYSNVDWCNWSHYYYNSTNWIDFPTVEGGPIIWIMSYKKGIIVFKANSIHIIEGDPDVAIQQYPLSENVGTYSGASVQLWNDMIIFLWQDGIYVTGEQEVLASLEDNKLRTSHVYTNLTTEIRNWWENYIVYPDVTKMRNKTWLATDGFLPSSFYNVEKNSDLIGNLPDVINFVKTGTSTSIESYTTTAGAVWVDLTAPGGTDDWYAQGFKIDTTDYPIGDKILLYLKKTGTLTSAMKLNVYLCANNSDDEPDFNNVYAQGQMALNGVISTTGDWYTITMSYWDYPQNMLNGSATPPQLWIACKADGVDASNYISWAYQATGAYTNGTMKNSDDSTPASQAAADYLFNLYGKYFFFNGYLITLSAQASADFTCWGTITVNLDTSTIGGYIRNSYLWSLRYELSADSSSWDPAVEIENGGTIDSVDLTKRYIRITVSFRRPSATGILENDSFTLRSVMATYYTQSIDKQLIGSAVYKNRYWLSLRKKIFGVKFTQGE